MPPPPLLQHPVPKRLHRLEPVARLVGERGDRIAAGLVMRGEAMADQAERADGVNHPAARSDVLFSGMSSTISL